MVFQLPLWECIPGKMIENCYLSDNWKYGIISLLLITLSASSELTKDELLAKIETCNATVQQLQADISAAEQKGGTQQEVNEAILRISSQFPIECQMELCNQIRAQVEKELAEEKRTLTNPQQSDIDTLKQRIEAQYPVDEACGSGKGDGYGPMIHGGFHGGNRTSGNLIESLSNVLKDVAADDLIKVLKDKSVTESFSSSELSLYGEKLVKKLGGAKKVRLADIKDIGPAIVQSILPGDYKYLSDDVFKYILNQIYLETTKAVENEFGDGQPIQVEMDVVSTEILKDVDSARIKALCGRAFRMYRTAKQITDGWNNIKFLMFCAPPGVCKNVNYKLIQNDLNAFGFQPWVCKNAKLEVDEDQQSRFHDFLVRTDDMIQKTRKLFPSNKPCGKILAEKAVTDIPSPFQKNSTETVERFRYMISCLPDSVFKKAIDDVGCNFGGEMYKLGALSQKLTRYTAKKCLSSPPRPDNVTCTSLETDYKPFLLEIKRSFFKSLPQAVMCDVKCMELFKSEEKFPKDVMKYITKTCFKNSATISSDDIKNLGGLVTDLPLDKFDQISATDLESNIQSIKKDLKAAKKQRGRKAVVKKLAKKMLNDGKVADLIDSKEIMKEVSLKDLKTSLSQSDDIIKALGINDTQSTLGFTNSQKKWVVKQVVKKKQAGSFTLDDIKEMKSLVTGLLSSHIKKIGEAHTADTNAISFAVEMCSYPDWPRKSLEAINKHLIQTTLKVRNAADPMSALTNIDVQTLDCQCLLNFNTSLFGNMDKEVCSAVCMKIGYCDIFRCLNPIRRKNVLQACLKCKGLGSHTMTDTDFEELGPNLISQLSEAQLDLVPAEVLQTHIEFFKDICMDKTLRDALSEALMKVIGSSGSDYDSNTLFLLGSAIKVLPSTLQKDLNKTVIAEMQSELMGELVPETDDEKNLRKCCEKWLDTADLENLKEQNLNLMFTVKEAFFANVETSRKRRAATFKWTCRQIRPVPILFATASAKSIDIMEDKELLDCLEIIGKVSLKRWQQKLLFTKVQKALGQRVCSMPADRIEELGVLALAIHVHDIRCLPLNNTDVVASLGSLDGWNEQQLIALATRYMEVNHLSNLSSLTSEEVTMLGPILCGLPANQLVTITSAVFGKSGKDIGRMKECSIHQFAAFVVLAVQYDAYGPINTWDADDVSELKYIIAGLSGIEIKELSASAIEGLDPDVIPVIPRYVLKNLRSAHFRAFRPDQAVAVTNSQKNVLSQEQNFTLERILELNGPFTTLEQSSGVEIIGPVLGTHLWWLQLFPFIWVTIL